MANVPTVPEKGYRFILSVFRRTIKLFPKVFLFNEFDGTFFMDAYLCLSIRGIITWCANIPKWRNRFNSQDFEKRSYSENRDPVSVRNVCVCARILRQLWTLHRNSIALVWKNFSHIIHVFWFSFFSVSRCSSHFIYRSLPLVLTRLIRSVSVCVCLKCERVQASRVHRLRCSFFILVDKRISILLFIPVCLRWLLFVLFMVSI